MQYTITTTEKKIHVQASNEEEALNVAQSQMKEREAVIMIETNKDFTSKD